MTIKDIAAIAGVSPATVSHVVNKTKYVSPNLEKRVNDVIRDLDELPNFIIRKRLPLPTKKQYIAFLVSSLADPVSAEIYTALCAAAAESSYTILPYQHSDQRSVLDLFFATIYCSDNLQGVIASSSSDNSILWDYLHNPAKPFAALNAPARMNALCTVCSDDVESGRKAANHLFRSGHLDIAFLYRSDDCIRDIKRMEGFRQAFIDHQIPFMPQCVIGNLTDKPAIAKAFQRMWDDTMPTALLASDQEILLASLSQIHSRGLNIPKDISIIGFDTYDWVEVFSPSLDTVNQDSVRIAQALLNCMERQLQPEAAELPEQIIIPSVFRVRNSTAGIDRGPLGELAATVDSLLLTEFEKTQICKGNFTAAISFHYTGHAFTRLVEQGMRHVFDALNISITAITDAHFDPLLQTKQLNGILSMQPDVLISMPSALAGMENIYKNLIASGVKLGFVGNSIPIHLSAKDYVTSTGSSSRSLGQCIGNAIGEYMIANQLENLGVLTHQEDLFFNANERDEIIRQIIHEEYPDISIAAAASFKKADAYDAAIQLVTEHPEIQMLYVLWEAPAVSVLRALQELGREDIAIATMDLDYDVAMSMAEGGPVKVICAQYVFEIGQALATAMAASLIGKKVPSFIGNKPFKITIDTMLNAWQDIFLEPAPREMVDAVKKNLHTN